ncbi:unnamed protein product [Rhizophagus irregularis]|nr:unnamed protein product [Rhizophagus irregularis]
MPPLSKQFRHLKKAREIGAQKLKAKKNETRLKKHHPLYSTIDQLSEVEVKRTQHLLNKMRYPKGPQRGQILSPYLQDKALSFIEDHFYKSSKTDESIESLNEANKVLHQRVQKLEQNKQLVRRTQSLGASIRHLQNKQDHHISEIRSLVRRSTSTSPSTFKKHIKSLFKENEKHYTTDAIWLATQITQVGQVSVRSATECMKLMYEFLIGEPPKTWLSHSTLVTWHKDISQLYTNSIICEIQSVTNYGIMVNESKRGEIKNFLICFMFWNKTYNKPFATMTHLQNLDKCDGKSVAMAVQTTINNSSIDPKKCSVWLTDNTAYMSGDKNGAIVLFNRLTGSNSVRIGCGLHIMHIVFNNFENAAFGKLPSAIGFTKVAHPYNLAYLAWELHDGYDSSDKNKALDMTGEKIKELYQNYLGIHFTQYQRPICGRWGYELLTIKQYLERRTFHLAFADWFIESLENLHKPPQAYVQKWRLFMQWMQDPKLTIQIKCLMRFGVCFYEPLMQFIVGQDPKPRIIHENNLEQLPPGCRAHEMPDKVMEWINYLNNIKENFDSFFAEELLEAVDSLEAEQFGEIFDGLNSGMQKAFDHFKKWMDPWCHLPLSICKLGGNFAQSFAQSFYYVVLKQPWIN